MGQRQLLLKILLITAKRLRYSVIRTWLRMHQPLFLQAATTCVAFISQLVFLQNAIKGWKSVPILKSLRLSVQR
eukprot:3523613-Karenia_brevis.AAC.1